MARAFECFAKNFSRAYGVAAWRVVASYDRSVGGKDAAGRRYRGSVARLRESVLEEFSATSGPEIDFKGIEEIVRERTVRESPIAEAIEREALRIDEQLSLLDDGAEAGSTDPAGPWDVIGIAFALDDGFRTDFDEALRADGFGGDTRGLWLGVERIADSLGEGANSSDFDEIVRCQREIAEALVLAALYGPCDYAQLVGYDADVTPVPVMTSEAVVSPPRKGVRLQGVVPTGHHPWDYATSPLVAWELPAKGARIGRDECWCGEDGYTAVIVPVGRVSRRHCEIERHGQRWILRDLSSANGTLLVRPDGAGVILSGEGTTVRSGDIICLAPRRVRPGYESSCFEWVLGDAETCLRFELVSA